MAIDFQEALYWLQDLREHLRVARRREDLRKPGRGVDYTQGQGTERRIVSRLHPERMQLRLAEISQATPSTKTYSFERIDGPLPPFRAAQYINLYLDVDGVRTSRPYSIASAPGVELLELTVKDNPGGFVAPYLLEELAVGDPVESSGPAGNFYYEPLIDGCDLVFLAGGSGITPFMSMLRSMLGSEGKEQSLHIQLLYGSRFHDDVIYGDELAALAQAHENFDYSLVVSEPPPDYQGLTGLLDADLVREQVGELDGKTFYICGPPVMYAFCQGSLEALCIPRHKIKRELFGPPEDITQEAGWPQRIAAERVFEVEVVGHKSIRAPAGEPLMNTLERYGIVVPALCRVGACSECRVRLLSGKVFMPENTGIRESDRQYGYIHACVSYPLEDL